MLLLSSSSWLYLTNTFRAHEGGWDDSFLRRPPAFDRMCFTKAINLSAFGQMSLSAPYGVCYQLPTAMKILPSVSLCSVIPIHARSL